MERQAVSTLKHLLLSRDLAPIRQGVELAASLGDGDLVDHLLADVHYDTSQVIWVSDPLVSGMNFKGVGVLRSAQLLDGNLKEWAWFQHALVGLVARGPGARAAALRAQVRSLVLHYPRDSDPPADLWFLEGLDALEEVAAYSRYGVSNAGSLGRLPRLRRARIAARRSTAIRALEGIAAAPALVDLELWGQTNLTHLAGSHVEKLTIVDDDRDDLEGVARMSRLRELTLRIKGPFHGLGGAVVERLTVEGTFMKGAGALPRLRSLRCVRLEGLTEAPELDELHAREVKNPPVFPRLRVAHVESAGSVAEHAASFPALEELTCGGLSMDRLDALARLPRLRTVLLASTLSTKATDGVPPLAYRLKATGAPVTSLTCGMALESLRDVARLGPIRDLTLKGCNRLETLAGLEELTDLRTLDLRGCTALEDATALAGLDLRAVAVFNCPLGLEGGLPEEIQWAVTKAQEPDLGALGTRERPAAKPKKKAKAAAREVDEALWARIAEKIRHKTPDGMDQAADLAREGGLAVYERLLRGASFADGTFRGSGLGLPGNSVVKQQLYRRLVAEAPEGCAVAEALRPKVTSLSLDGREGVAGWGPGERIDLRALPAFPNLREVQVRKASHLLFADAFSRCPALEEVRFETIGEPPLEARWFVGTPVHTLEGGFASVAGAPGIQGLRRYLDRGGMFRANVTDLSGCAALDEVLGVQAGPETDLRGMPALRVLDARVSGAIQGWVSPSLRELGVRGVTAVGDMRGLVALRTLSIASPRLDLAVRGTEGQLTRPRPLDGLGPLPPSLAELTLTSATVGEARELESLDALAHVTIHEPEAGDDLTWLRRLGALRTLKLGASSIDFSVLHPLPIEALEVRNLDEAQAAALAAHPTLRRVRTLRRDAEQLLPERLRVNPSA